MGRPRGADTRRHDPGGPVPVPVVRGRGTATRTGGSGRRSGGVAEPRTRRSRAAYQGAGAPVECSGDGSGAAFAAPVNSREERREVVASLAEVGSAGHCFRDGVRPADCSTTSLGNRGRPRTPPDARPPRAQRGIVVRRTDRRPDVVLRRPHWTVQMIFRSPQPVRKNVRRSSIVTNGTQGRKSRSTARSGASQRLPSDLRKFALYYDV